jgi:DnaJ family protein B protein 12
MNKDEAEKWKNIAKEAIANHDYHKAIRFLGKSKKLFDTSEADGLITLCEMNLKNRGSAGDAKTETPSGAYKRNTPKPAEPEREKNYTSEEVHLCKGILAKTNYYDILGIQKGASEGEIKKAYRKLALKLHPDKNNAPTATDAFKKVSTSYMWLSDVKKKQIYDEHGTEDNFQQNYRQYFREDEMFDPFDLFDLFTGGNMQGRRRQYRPQRQAQRQHHNHQHDENRNPLQQFGPFVLIIIMFIFLSLTSNLNMGPSFSLTKTSQYTFEHLSSTHNVKFFVDKDTHETMGGSAKYATNIDDQVDNEFYRIKTRDWRNAKDVQNHWARQARYYSKGHYRYTQYMEKANIVDMSAWNVVQEMNEKHE